MYNLSEKTIVLGNHSYRIERFEVWFQTPVGLMTTIDQAIEVLTGLEIDPRLGTVPVTVAIGPNDIYEVMSK